jgi:hypothetical protein
VQGRRLSDGYHYKDAEPGDYWKQKHKLKEDPCDWSDAGRNRDWDWTIKDPLGVLGTIGTHDVTEHDDGTITDSVFVHARTDSVFVHARLVDNRLHKTVGMVVALVFLLCHQRILRGLVAFRFQVCKVIPLVLGVLILG